jgi:TP901 family phage tail tape measure protein
VADRSVKLILSADIQGLRSQLTAAKASVTDFAKTADKRIQDNRASAEGLATSFGVVGAATVGLAGLAVKRFADFDKAMSSVRASTRATGSELESLRSAAVRAGADTAFSAEEAAQGIDELAKAGVSTTAILGGGLSGALNLAAAGQLSVAEAAETAASAMVQFNLDGSQVGHVADLLAAGAGKAQGSVHDMGAALQQSGLIAAQTGLSIEETTAALAAMASAGLVGSDAGTSLKTALVALSAPSSTAAKEMERLGISAYDANGQFVGLEALAGNLESSLKDLTPAQRNAAMATIFGTDALRTANVLYEQGAAGVAEWTDKVNDSGYAAETARIQTDNLAGDLERLGGAFDTALIQSGSGANDVLRSLVQGAEELVDAFGRVPAPVLSTIGLLAGGGGLALVGVAGLVKLAGAVRDTRDQMRDLGLISEKTAGKVGKVGRAAASLAAVAAAGAGAAIAMDKLTDSSDKAAAGVDATKSALLGVDGSDVNSLFKDLGGDVDNLAEGLDLLVGPNIEKFGSTLNTLFTGGQLSDQVADTAAQFENIGQALASMVASGDAVEAAQQFEEITAAAEAQGISVEEVERLMPAYVEALAAAKNAQASTASATEAATAATEDQTQAVEDNWKAHLEAVDAILGLRDANRGLEQAIDDASATIDENGKTLNANTEKGRANQAALDGIAAAGHRAVDAAREQGASSSELTGIMAKTRDEFIKSARAAGLSKDAANALADELRLIPKDVKVRTSVDTAAAKASAQNLVQYINGLNATITVRERHVSSGAPGSRSGGITFASGGYTGAGGKFEIAGPVHKGEWVIRQESVKSLQSAAPGLLDALNASGARALEGYASGGEVGAARSDVLRKRRAVEAARAVWRRSRTDQNEARLERARDAADAARERYGRLLEEQDSVRTQLRRGEISSDVTGGLSGALGVTDQLRDLANSGDISSRRSRLLKNTANDAEKALKSLYTQAERIDKRLERATDRLEKWQGIADGVASSISSGFSLGDVSGGVDQWSGQERQATGQQLLAASLDYQGKARALVVKLRALQDAGYGTAILQEVAAQGVEGGVAMADALLSLSPKERKALQASQKAIDFYAGRAGVAVTDGNLTDAQRDVRSAEAQATAIDKRINGWARRISREFAATFGIKARASGGPTMAGGAYLVGEQGPELHVPRSSGYVVNADKTANILGGGGPTYTFNTTNYYPVAEPESVATNRVLAKAASTGRF